MSAEANQQKAQLDEDRYIPLAEQQAITQQDLDNATAEQSVAESPGGRGEGAGGNRASADRSREEPRWRPPRRRVETAKVNLGFTKLVSPIDGIVGVATTQVGNLVGPSSNAVTTVSTLDPIKANFTVSEQEYLSLTRHDSRHEQPAARIDSLRRHRASRTKGDSPSPTAR